MSNDVAKHRNLFLIAYNCYERVAVKKCDSIFTLDTLQKQSKEFHITHRPSMLRFQLELIHYYTCQAMSDRTRKAAVVMFETFFSNKITEVVREQRDCAYCCEKGLRFLNDHLWDGFAAIGKPVPEVMKPKLDKVVLFQGEDGDDDDTVAWRQTASSRAREDPIIIDLENDNVNMNQEEEEEEEEESMHYASGADSIESADEEESYHSMDVEDVNEQDSDSDSSSDSDSNSEEMDYPEEEEEVPQPIVQKKQQQQSSKKSFVILPSKSVASPKKPIESEKDETASSSPDESFESPSLELIRANMMLLPRQFMAEFIDKLRQQRLDRGQCINFTCHRKRDAHHYQCHHCRTKTTTTSQNPKAKVAHLHRPIKTNV